MLKVTQPYVRETAVRDQKQGKAIVIKIEPPGLTIGFRLRGERTTWHLNLLDAYMAARYTAHPDVSEEKPKAVKHPSIKEELLRVLEAQGKLNIAQIMQQMKDKGLGMKRAEAGTILELMKDAGMVKQEGFSYSLVKGGGK